MEDASLVWHAKCFASKKRAKSNLAWFLLVKRSEPAGVMPSGSNLFAYSQLFVL